MKRTKLMKKIRLNALLIARVNEHNLWREAMQDTSKNQEYFDKSKLVSILYRKVREDLEV